MTLIKGQKLILIIQGLQKCISLGNLDSTRDWGHAKDYVEGMWLMLQAEKPTDFVLATGKTISVRTMVEEAFRYNELRSYLGMREGTNIKLKRDLKGVNSIFRNINVKITWKGRGLDEEGIDAETGETRIRIDPKFFRPAEVEALLGDPTKAKKLLGWEAKTGFKDLIKEMVEHDIEMMKKDPNA